MWGFTGAFITLLTVLFGILGVLFTVAGSRKIERELDKSDEWQMVLESRARTQAYRHRLQPFILASRGVETTDLTTGDGDLISTVSSHQHSWVDVRLSLTDEKVGRFCTSCNTEKREPGW